MTLAYMIVPPISSQGIAKMLTCGVHKVSDTLSGTRKLIVSQSPATVITCETSYSFGDLRPRWDCITIRQSNGGVRRVLKLSLLWLRENRDPKMEISCWDASGCRSMSHLNWLHRAKRQKPNSLNWKWPPGCDDFPSWSSDCWGPCQSTTVALVQSHPQIGREIGRLDGDHSDFETNRT